MAAKYALIFCSASKGIDEDFDKAASEVVRMVWSHGYGIVSGGTVKGTMNVVGNAAAALGAPHKGVLPRFMKGLEHPALTEIVWTDTMSERKEEMRKGTSLVVALPGGIGTLDEFFETFTLAKLGQYDGRILVYNVKHFFDPLRELLDYFVRTGMLDAASRSLVSFPEDPEELEKELG